MFRVETYAYSLLPCDFDLFCDLGWEGIGLGTPEYRTFQLLFVASRRNCRRRRPINPRHVIRRRLMAS
jgi:hypothetical protein